MANEFGDGIFLDEALDFSIDPTGDIQAARGVEELEKDLSVQMIAGLDQYLGSPPSGNLRAKVLNTATNIATADPRVLSVVADSSAISFSRNRQKLNVKLLVRTVSGQQELIFNIE
jgi:hypothetical protein